MKNNKIDLNKKLIKKGLNEIKKNNIFNSVSYFEQYFKRIYNKYKTINLNKFYNIFEKKIRFINSIALKLISEFKYKESKFLLSFCSKQITYFNYDWNLYSLTNNHKAIIFLKENRPGLALEILKEIKEIEIKYCKMIKGDTLLNLSASCNKWELHQESLTFSLKAIDYYKNLLKDNELNINYLNMISISYYNCSIEYEYLKNLNLQIKYLELAKSILSKGKINSTLLKTINNILNEIKKANLNDKSKNNKKIGKKLNTNRPHSTNINLFITSTSKTNIIFNILNKKSSQNTIIIEGNNNKINKNKKLKMNRPLSSKIFNENIDIENDKNINKIFNSKKKFEKIANNNLSIDKINKSDLKRVKSNINYQNIINPFLKKNSVKPNKIDNISLYKNENKYYKVKKIYISKNDKSRPNTTSVPSKIWNIKSKIINKKKIDSDIKDYNNIENYNIINEIPIAKYNQYFDTENSLKDKNSKNNKYIIRQSKWINNINNKKKNIFYNKGINSYINKNNKIIIKNKNNFNKNKTINDVKKDVTQFIKILNNY